MTDDRDARGSRWLNWIYAALLLVIGLFLAAGGGWLATLGGSLYYLVTGLVVIASAVLIARGDRRGIWLYGAMLVGTLAWAIGEVGFDGWALVPRLVAPAVLGVGLLLPLRRGKAIGRGWATFAAGLVAALLVGSGLHAIGPRAPADPLYQAGVADRTPDASRVAASGDGDWLHYGNDEGGTRFSPLTQLTPQTVGKLDLAWTADTGPIPAGAKVSMEVTPLKIGDSLYVCTAFDTVMALDAETGKQRWRHDGATSRKSLLSPACRGVAYYRTPGANGLCAERIISVTHAAELIALDAPTGQLCPGFGQGGKTSLLTGLTEAPLGYYTVSSAPQIVRGKIVLGGAVLDGQYWGEPSGVIRAYDAVTGKFSWAFDMGRPDDHAEPTDGQTYTPSTPNSWAPISADEGLGLVYLPIGNAVPDYYGAQRRPFDDLNSSSVIALDVATGALRWRFQTARHDLWDYDVSSQPTLVDIPTPGGVRHALIQPTKRGEMFVLDRATGRPIAPVRELPVPQGGTAPGERLSPTQPFSVGMPSFRGPDLREANMWGVTPLDQMLCRIKFKQARYEGTMTPPGLDRPNLVAPGYLGGSDWGGVSVDTDRGIMIVNSNRMPNYDQLLTREEAKKRGMGIVGVSKTSDPSRGQPMEHTPYAVDVQPFLSVLGAPCNAPPYGLLTAVDLRTHKVLWNTPLGTARDSGPLGLHSMLPVPMGLPNAGGSVTTRGGLVFIAAAQERTIRAIDTATGKELWSARLPGGGQATPMTYWSPRSQRQFVVIAAGGSQALQSKTGATLVAYALPR